MSEIYSDLAWVFKLVQLTDVGNTGKVQMEWERGQRGRPVVGVVGAKNRIYIESMAKNRRGTLWVYIYMMMIWLCMYV